MELTEVDSAALFGLITMVTWGIRIVAGSAASRSIDPRTAVATSYLIAVLLAFGFVVVSGASLVVITRGGLLTGVVGLCTDVGLTSVYIGFTHGSTIVVSTLGAMYFAAATIIGVAILGENLTVTKLTGIAFAVFGIVLVTR